MSTADPYTAARLELQRVATHVLARARFAADGRFGLRVTPSGIGTPPFGPEGTVLRIAGLTLIREAQLDGASRSAVTALCGRSLGELAAFAGVDVASPFAAGHDTPQVGDPATPIDIDTAAGSMVLAWLHLGAEVLDRVLPATDQPAVAQLWPEHFDLGIDVASSHGRVNLGVSPGDDTNPEPYLYVAPWEGSRPGDPTFWNAALRSRARAGRRAGLARPGGAGRRVLPNGTRPRGPSDGRLIGRPRVPLTPHVARSRRAAPCASYGSGFTTDMRWSLVKALPEWPPTRRLVYSARIG